MNVIMKNDKFCFNKSFGLLFVLVVAFGVLAFVLSQMPKVNTSTNTKAAAPMIVGGTANSSGCYEYNNSSHCASDCMATHGNTYQCSGTMSFLCCPRTDKIMVDIKIKNNFPRSGEITGNRIPRGDYFVSFDSNVYAYLKKIGGTIKKTSIYCDKFNTKTQSYFTGNTVQDGFGSTCSYRFISNVNEQKFTPYYEVTYSLNNQEKTESFFRELTAYLEITPTQPSPQPTQIIIIPCSEGKECSQNKICINLPDTGYPTQCSNDYRISFISKDINLDPMAIKPYQVVKLGIGTNVVWGSIDFKIYCDTTKQAVSMRKVVSKGLNTEENFSCVYNIPGVYTARLEGILTQGSLTGVKKTEEIHFTVK